MRDRETAHISSTGRPDGRRVNDARGTRTTWCGAPITAADVTPEDARRWISSAWTQGPARCEKCFAMLAQMDAKPDGRIAENIDGTWTLHYYIPNMPGATGYRHVTHDTGAQCFAAAKALGFKSVWFGTGDAVEEVR